MDNIMWHQKKNFEKKLLVVSHSYNDFVKDPLEQMSFQFKYVCVLVRSNTFAEIANNISIPYLYGGKLSRKIDLTKLPSNIEVHSTPIVYAPFDSQYKKLGEKHLRAVEKAIDKNNIKFDIVHSHFTWSAGYVGAKLKEKYDIPFVVTAHGYDIYDLPFRDDEWKHKIEYVLNAADCIITVSNSNLECIKKLDVDTPVEVIPNGFNDDIFRPMNSEECRKNLNLPIDKKIILTVGNLVEVKGHKYLIEAMSEVVKHRKDVLCIIVGKGQLKHKLVKQIKSAGLQDYVKLVGEKPHDEISLWMNACDVFVLPSLNEGNPTVMFECLGCGKPFIGTRVGGIPEIITSEDYGLLVEPCDYGKLVETIQIALNKKWNYEIIGVYSNMFTWKKIATEILDVYKKID